MNKAYVIPILILICVAGYFLLQHFGLLTQLTSPLNSITTQISGYLEGFNTFIKNNSWFTPVLGIAGSLSAAGIVKWFSNRAQDKAVSNLQNASFQVQNDMTKTYSQSVTSLQNQVQTLEGQLTQANQQLAAIPNISELQAAYQQKLKEVETLRIQFQTLEAELTRQKIQVVPVTVVK